MNAMKSISIFSLFRHIETIRKTITKKTEFDKNTADCTKNESVVVVDTHSCVSVSISIDKSIGRMVVRYPDAVKDEIDAKRRAHVIHHETRTRTTGKLEDNIEFYPNKNEQNSMDIVFEMR